MYVGVYQNLEEVLSDVVTVVFVTQNVYKIDVDIRVLFGFAFLPIQKQF